MDPILKRQLERLEYVRPEELMHAVKDAGGNYTEKFQAGFVALMVQRLSGPGATVLVRYGEIQDADAVVKLAETKIPLEGQVPAYTLVQLKEIHPHPQNKRGICVQEFLDDLKRKYPRSPDLIVAIHVNQSIDLDYSKLDLRGLGIGQLYFFGGDEENDKIYGAPLSHWRAGVVFWGHYNRKSAEFTFGKCPLNGGTSTHAADDLGTLDHRQQPRRIP